MAAGVLRVGVQLEPPNLDPTSGAAAAIDEIVYANVFEGLTRINEDGSVLPALASKWSVSEDGLIYTFDLREDVSFHDGVPFTARDVKFSLERAGAPTSSNAQRAIFSIIDRVDIMGDHRVRIMLSEPLGAFLTYLGWGDAVIVSEKSAATNATQPVGTGPFRFVSWRRGASVLLARHENYWGPAPALNGVQFFFIPDPTAAFAALMAGDIDGFPNYPAPENLSLIKRDERFKVLRGTSEGEIILAINNAAPPFNDIRVRRALTHAINKTDIIEGALYGNGAPIGSHFPPHHPAYVDLSSLYPFDQARAQALLAEAGFPEGFETTLYLPPPAYARRSGEIIAAQLAAIGVTARIQNIEWAQWLDQVFGNNAYELTIVAHTEPLDIDIYARGDYYFKYRNEEFNTVIAALRAETDEQARGALYEKAQRILAEDAVNVFLASGPKLGVWRKEVEGVWTNGPLQANDLTQADVPGRPSVSFNGPVDPRAPVLPLLAAVTALLLGAVLWLSKASAAFIAARLGSMALTLFAATIVIFFILEIAPGDPAAFMMGVNADPQSVAALRAELGLDRPAPARYAAWIGGLATGDFGQSYTYREPVAALIAERLSVSLPLAALAFVLSTAIGIPAGFYAAARRRRPADRTIRTLAQAGVAMPNFWLAILMVMIFAVFLRWFSAGGFPGWEAGFFPALKALALPAVALALPQAAILTQIMRTSMVDILERDFIRTARAKGLPRDQALRRHGLRNALIPVLTILGLQFAFLVAGAVIIENVFYLPGLGRLAFQAIAQRDLIVVKGVVVTLVFLVIFATFIVDLAYAIVDPRLRKRATE